MEQANLTELADLLREYTRSRNTTKEIKADMLRIAVEGCGISQKDAMQTDLPSFIDGFLVAHGVTQSWRSE